MFGYGGKNAGKSVAPDAADAGKEEDFENIAGAEKIETETNPNSGASPVGMDSSNPGAQAATSPHVDTDTAECVICLTDPKEVAVYPCRHLCLCMACAEALPSQSNKCPICRREAQILLHFKS